MDFVQTPDQLGYNPWNISGFLPNSPAGEIPGPLPQQGYYWPVNMAQNSNSQYAGELSFKVTDFQLSSWQDSPSSFLGGVKVEGLRLRQYALLGCLEGVQTTREGGGGACDKKKGYAIGQKRRGL